jgi:hypothetical protein
MPEQIGILLLFLVVVLFNLIAGFLKRRRERDARDAKRTVAQAPARSGPAAPRTVIPAPPLDVAPRAPAEPMERHRRGIPRASDLRRAIVMMTILGPPRALDDERRERSR